MLHVKELGSHYTVLTNEKLDRLKTQQFFLAPRKGKHSASCCCKIGETAERGGHSIPQRGPTQEPAPRPEKLSVADELWEAQLWKPQGPSRRGPTVS